MDRQSKYPSGRGALSRPAGRFEHRRVEAELDADPEADSPALETRVQAERARRIISINRSPDVPFTQSINPYRGCEHGCIYCYARPSHAYLGLSPGLDFETHLFFKENAARRLEEEFARTDYRPQPITLGANTDPWQPLERRLAVTRSLLEVMARYRHPVNVITKSSLIERDLDLLAELAAQRLVSVTISVTTLDAGLKRVMEPRAASPARRLQSIERLASAGIPVGVLIAPVIPALTDHELESIVAAVAAAGASSAGYVLLRLPHEVAALFREWLEAHFPLRAARIMNAIRGTRGGRDYDGRFGHRMRGTGDYARLLERRFRLASRRHGLDRGEPVELDRSRFVAPARRHAQLGLFGAD